MSSNWDYWFKIEKYRFFNQQPCLNDFYHRYPEDIKIAKELNFNSLRTSIQWTRLIPDGKTINPKGVTFYNNVINEMLKNNIKPIINLFHFDMPHWAQEKGGWLSREVVDAFAIFGTSFITVIINQLTSAKNIIMDLYNSDTFLLSLFGKMAILFSHPLMLTISSLYIVGFIVSKTLYS
ncbi:MULTISPECIES: family 1 glycosylhydrolase [unclassified Spiroplasma]|uniref:family 1 glycosylhydrolase n=1 Tax=unclassified Spiroplasma TaxID=2637901 RepID=UPI0030CE9029